MRPHAGADVSSALQDERLHVEAQRDALRSEVARLRASCDHMRAVIDHARRQTSLPDCLRALDGA